MDPVLPDPGIQAETLSLPFVEKVTSGKNSGTDAATPSEKTEFLQEHDGLVATNAMT